MPFVLLLGAAFVIGTVGILRAIRSRKLQLKSALRAFGSPLSRERDMDRVASLFRNREPKASSVSDVSDRTWRDLEMDHVFAFLDRTASTLGSQVLYDRLRRPNAGEALIEELNDLAEVCRHNRQRWVELYTVLHPLNDRGSSYLADILWSSGPPPLRYGNWLIPLAILPSAFAILAVFWPKLLFVALGFLAVNLMLRVSARSRIDSYVAAFRSLPAFARAARSILASRDEVLVAARERMLPHQHSLRYLVRSTRLMVLDASSDDALTGPFAEVTLAVQEYLSSLLLLDLLAYQLVALRLHQLRTSLQALFLELGEIDVALALASIRHEAAGSWCRPQTTSEARTLVVKALVHPVLKTPVPNDIEMDGRNWLITGSNMSGKSTLLRAVGVNVVVGRALGTVFAREWRAPRLSVQTVIHVDEGLALGKSYFLSECEAVREMLEASSSEHPHLFIVDELFRGTNTIERLAAAYAVLAFLDKPPHLVLVATHDIELARWLDTRYDLFHLREEVVAGQLTFDFLLRPGAASRGNAIALLAATKFPEEVVRTATEVVRRELEERDKSPRLPRD